MPELPEVSYYKKYVDATALHQTIKEIKIEDTYILEASEKELKDTLIGQKLESSTRHGKFIFMELTSGKSLMFHFGMTGHFEYLKHEELPKYAYFSLIFEDNARLCFVCPRKLARVYLAKDHSTFIENQNLGVDALDLDLETFRKLLSGKRGSIKGALLDQHLIAGLGNMYADEVLFQTHIHPNSKINTLKQVDIEKIFHEIKPVLEAVIKAQSEDKSLPENYLTPHRGKGKKCPTCNTNLEKMQVAGRSTYYCPKEQTEPED